jgi:hypothetical protein
MHATATLSAPPSEFTTIDALLRDRSALLDRIDAGTDLTALARTLALTLIVATAIVGATIGAFRGGLQIPFAAIKLPLVVLLTAALTTPAYSALAAAIYGDADLRRDATVVLATLTLGALLLSALAPVLLLAVFFGMSYHALALLFAATCLVSGLGGASLFWSAQQRRSTSGRWLVAGIVMLTFASVGSQISWTLRPYLVRPRAPEVVFIRAIEGSLFDAILQSSRSANGHYLRDEAPLPVAPMSTEPNP